MVQGRVSSVRAWCSVCDCVDLCCATAVCVLFMGVAAVMLMRPCMFVCGCMCVLSMCAACVCGLASVWCHFGSICVFGFRGCFCEFWLLVFPSRFMCAALAFIALSLRLGFVKNLENSGIVDWHGLDLDEERVCAVFGYGSGKLPLDYYIFWTFKKRIWLY